MAENNERLTFRPSARLAKILGVHLIRDNTTGVLELIKNGYDADADHVLIELKDLSDSEKTVVIIEDNGTGMDEATIKGPWSEPAHGGKQKEKDENHKSKKGRLPLGEKGVGRFATQKLGRYLDMTTRTEDSEYEYHVHIDWEKFDRPDAYMDQVGFTLEKQTPEIFTGNKHGTHLKITEANTPWKKSNVERLQASLIRLLSPTQSVQDFNVELKCVEYPELQNLERGDILERYQFKIDCSINDDGKASYVFYNRTPDGKVEKREGDDDPWSHVDADWKKFSPLCGPLRIVICAWLRTASNLKNYEMSGERLNILSGISIYRDGFRIVPYGDTGDDWLKLDPRRTNQPGQKYGNNQIIGQVEITQDKNKELVDKTNREGLQENQAFFDMAKLVRGVVSILENESMEERTKAKKTTQTAAVLKTEINNLKEEIQELKSTIQQPAEIEKPELTSETATSEQDSTTSETVEVPAHTIKSLENKAEKIDKYTDEAIRELSEEQEEKRDTFLHLMGIGLAAERFCHEFDRMVAGLSANLESLEEKHPYNSNVKALRGNFDSLKNEVALMSVARYIRRPPKPIPTSVIRVIDMSLDAHKSYIVKHTIQVEFSREEDFTVTISTASLSQILDNVIANAIYWLHQKSEIQNRKLHIAVNSNDQSIVISNNGTQVPKHIEGALFKGPFVSSKPDGRGLGMYIVKEILSKNNGTIKLLEDDDRQNKYGHVAFMISFNQ